MLQVRVMDTGARILTKKGGLKSQPIQESCEARVGLSLIAERLGELKEGVAQIWEHKKNSLRWRVTGEGKPQTRLR